MSTITETNTIDHGLFYRMTNQVDTDHMDSEPIGEVSSVTITDANNTPIMGSELMAAVSELSLTINHDKTYKDEYITLYHLIKSIANKDEYITHYNLIQSLLRK